MGQSLASLRGASTSQALFLGAPAAAVPVLLDADLAGFHPEAA
jgi:hypothetical protein